MCKRVCAQTIQHASQGRTLDYSPIECMPAMLASSVQAVVACMQCNCAEGLHFSTFHLVCNVLGVHIVQGVPRADESVFRASSFVRWHRATVA